MRTQPIASSHAANNQTKSVCVQAKKAVEIFPTIYRRLPSRYQTRSCSCWLAFLLFRFLPATNLTANYHHPCPAAIREIKRQTTHSVTPNTKPSLRFLKKEKNNKRIEQFDAQHPPPPSLCVYNIYVCILAFQRLPEAVAYQPEYISAAFEQHFFKHWATSSFSCF